MEKSKKKSANIFKSVTDRLSQFFHKEEGNEQELLQAPATSESEEANLVEESGTSAPDSIQEAEKNSESVMAEESKTEKDKAAVSKSQTIVERETHKKGRRRIIRKEKPKVKAGKTHSEEVVPIISLPDEAVGPAIYDFVMEHISDSNLSVDMMASQLKSSRTGLYALVHREFGVTPGNFILDLRLKYAESLLKKGVKVREVSAKCGFSDPKYFSKVFKKYYGILPSSFKNEE